MSSAAGHFAMRPLTSAAINIAMGSEIAFQWSQFWISSFRNQIEYNV